MANKSVAEMFGDWLREASVLVAVFAWLDKRIHDEPFTGTWAVEALGLALLLFVLRVVVERIRPKEA